MSAVMACARAAKASRAVEWSVSLVALVLLLALVASDGAAQEHASSAAGATAWERTLSADTLLFPEGLDVDPRDGTLYVTSLRYRNVLIVSGDDVTPARWLLESTEKWRRGGVFGVAVDTTAGLIWLTTAPTPHMQPTAADGEVRAELLRVALSTGSVTGRWILGDGTGTPGEIAVSPRGDVLVSDGTKGRLYRLRSGSPTLEVIENAALRSPQGIAVQPGGAVAYVADWSRGILRWDLLNDEIAPVQSAGGSTLRGIDGLRWWRGGLIGVQNGAVPHRVVRIALDATGRQLRAMDVLDAPEAPRGEGTVGTVIGDRFVYVASSEWPFYTEAGERRASERPLPPLVVRIVPLDP